MERTQQTNNLRNAVSHHCFVWCKYMSFFSFFRLDYVLLRTLPNWPASKFALTLEFPSFCFLLWFLVCAFQMIEFVYLFLSHARARNPGQPSRQFIWLCMHGTYRKCQPLLPFERDMGQSSQLRSMQACCERAYWWYGHNTTRGDSFKCLLDWIHTQFSSIKFRLSGFYTLQVSIITTRCERITFPCILVSTKFMTKQNEERIPGKTGFVAWRTHDHSVVRKHSENQHKLFYLGIRSFGICNS